MNDFNRGALPVPCLRLDYGFGEQLASVELGDGTGYVRLADYEKAEAENAELKRAAERDADVLELLNLSLEESQAENAKLRELARDLRFCARQSNCLKCEHGRFCDLRLDERCKELGIEVKE